MGCTSLAYVAELIEFLQSQPDIQELDAFVIDINGHAIGKRLPIAQARRVFEEGMTLSACAPLFDCRGRGHNPLGIGGTDGDPDGVARPLAGTLVRAPWTTGPTAQVLCTLQERETEREYWFDPRAILQGVLDQCEAKGVRPVIACELEFYLVQRSRATPGLQLAAAPGVGTPPGRAMNLSLEAIEDHSNLFAQMASAAREQGLPLSGSVAEYGTGQFEINLRHVTNALLAADHAVLLKRLVRGVARANRMDATFMAKPFVDQPGNGLHVHVSLVDEQGRNRFGGPGGEVLLHQSIAGMQALMFESMGLFAPNFNSQRRFSGAFVSTSPTWGHNKRSVAFRIPLSSDADRRIEHRVAGADASPHLTLAAILAAMLHGISNDLSPSPPADSGAPSEGNPDFPHGLLEALKRTANSVNLPQYLPRPFLQAYTHVKRGERNALLAPILPGELDFYA